MQLELMENSSQTQRSLWVVLAGTVLQHALVADQAGFRGRLHVYN